jgi:hypothetical protein
MRYLVLCTALVLLFVGLTQAGSSRFLASPSVSDQALERQMVPQKLNTEELLGHWLVDYGSKLAADHGLLHIRRAEPRFVTHNYFARFKIETAKFDGTGQNPTDVACIVVEVSPTDQKATVAPATTCDAVKDL